MTTDSTSSVSRNSPSADSGGVRGYVSELFCSIQGEGPYAGEQQIFLRTAGCSGTCRWCDTGYSKKRTRTCKTHGRSDRVLSELQNPIDAKRAVREVLTLADEYPGARTVSITGGEPLEQPGFVIEVARRIRGEGFAVYLETNGIHDAVFADVLPFVDVVAMDIKLPTATGKAMWRQHGVFLSRIKGTEFDPESGSESGATAGEENGRSIFVKVVVDDETHPDEVAEAAGLVVSVSKRIPMIIQPESGYYARLDSDAESTRKRGKTLDGFLSVAAKVLDDVRVVPQVHKIFNVR